MLTLIQKWRDGIEVRARSETGAIDVAKKDKTRT
jgi:hypothetical protein